LNGIINVLKPIGMTSADIVRWILRKTKAKKAGHIGTLDPGAAGVLPVCVGKATKLAEYHFEQEKYYRAEITLGITTDTQDAFGKELTRVIPKVTQDEFQKILKEFQGRIEQIPPMYSAVRKDGKHLYEYARQGLEVTRAKRQAIIHKLEMTHWQEDVFPKALIDVECSKGTYIRTLCQDIGEYLGCGAHMSFLLRLRSSNFTIDSAFTLEEIERYLNHKDYSFVLDMGWGLKLPEVRIPQSRLAAFKNGLSTQGSLIQGKIPADHQPVKVFCGEHFIGIGIWDNNSLCPKKVLC
jgi:tRNA pseudouridine55 synthase